jgi:hypothetical protein
MNTSTDDFLEGMTKSILFYSLQLFNLITKAWNDSYTNVQRCVKGVCNEYRETNYYFYPGSDIPYIGKAALEHPAGVPLPTWIYTQETTTFTQTAAKDGKTEEHRFPWIDIDLKKGGEELSLLEYIPSVRWIGSSMEPPQLSILLRAWSLDNGMYLPFDEMKVTILHSGGKSYTLDISEDYPEELLERGGSSVSESAPEAAPDADTGSATPLLEAAEVQEEVEL